MKKHLTRRNFLGQSSCAAIGCTTFLSTLCNLKVMNAASISNSAVIGSGDYKAMICLMLAGGNDSYNMVIPTDTNQFNKYQAIRTNLAVNRNDIHELNGVNLGLHPAMPQVRKLFNNGKLSIVANIGTLLEPLQNKQQLWNGTAPVPLGLFSHSDQAQQWQTSIPHERSAVGWGGKISDLLKATNTNENISMNISLNGSNVFQKGNSTVEYAIDAYEGSIGMEGYDDQWQFGTLRKAAIDNMVDQSYADMFKSAYVDVIKIARDSHIEFSDALSNISPFTTQFSDNYLSESMHMIAKVIKARDTLGMKRQIFFVEYDGWDHHDEVLEAQNMMYGYVNNAMDELNDALEEMNMSDCVTTFTMSEFGRTLASNGNGTDHGWGGNVMVMGGAVDGGKVFGNYPDLELNSDIELGAGVYMPSLSVDEYFAELALWFGVSPTDLVDIFPNLGNFYSVNSGSMPIGFLNI